MESEMTEREFQTKMLAAARSPSDETFAELAVSIAREAGLEFAPEPALAVERLECVSEAYGPDIRPAGGRWVSTKEKAVTLSLAAQRYNEFPALQCRLEEAEAAAVAELEGREIIAELTAALAAQAGYELLKPCAAPCPGHLGPKASAAYSEALKHWLVREDRAVAYPGLRAAVESLIEQLYNYLGKPLCYMHPIADMLAPLENELAKGPK